MPPQCLVVGARRLRWMRSHVICCSAPHDPSGASRSIAASAAPDYRSTASNPTTVSSVTGANPSPAHFGVCRRSGRKHGHRAHAGGFRHHGRPVQQLVWRAAGHSPKTCTPPGRSGEPKGFRDSSLPARLQALIGGWCALDATPLNETRRMRIADRSLFNDAAKRRHRRGSCAI